MRTSAHGSIESASALDFLLLLSPAWFPRGHTKAGEQRVENTQCRHHNLFTTLSSLRPSPSHSRTWSLCRWSRGDLLSEAEKYQTRSPKLQRGGALRSRHDGCSLYTRPGWMAWGYNWKVGQRRWPAWLLWWWQQQQATASQRHALISEQPAHSDTPTQLFLFPVALSTSVNCM